MSEQRDLSTELLSAVRAELSALVHGGGAHATFEEAVKDFPVEFRGTVPENLPYSAWQIVEHIRIAQQDMLEFSKNSDGKYTEKKWPDDYWPKTAAPPSDDAWDQAVATVERDKKAFEKLVLDAGAAELVKPFAWGSGQTLLKEALQLADHNAYHVGELIVLRRVLGIWKR